MRAEPASAPRLVHRPRAAVVGQLLGGGTMEESSLARNRIAFAASSGLPERRSMFCTGRVGSNSSLPTGEPILFGTIALTRMLCGASCPAMVRGKLGIPALAAEEEGARG